MNDRFGDHFGLIVLGAVTTAALLGVAMLFALGWTTRVSTVALDLPMPMFYVPN